MRAAKFAALFLLAATPMSAKPVAQTSAIATAVASPERSADNVKLDESRKPAEMLAFARRRAQHHPGLSFHALSGPTLPFAPGSFDVVISCLSFRYLDWPRIWPEIRCVLAEGGRFVMVDLVRVGGITQWLKVAGMAEAFNLPIVSHLIPEVHVHLISAVPNGLTVEYMPRLYRLFEETPAIEDGKIVVPDRPGLGLAFDQAALKQYAVA